MVTTNYSKKQKSIELNKKQNWQQTNKKKSFKPPTHPIPAKNQPKPNNKEKKPPFLLFCLSGY